MDSKKYVIGVDIGGTSTKIGVVDAHGIIHDRKRIDKDKYGGQDVNIYVAELAKAIRQVAEQVGGLGNIRGVGIGAPNGNYYSKCIEFAPNLEWRYKGSEVIPIAQLVSNETGLPLKVVELTNDANAAAVGEMKYGGAIGMKHFIMITLGTGVGSGIVIDGKVVYGYDGFAGELGHTIQVRNNGRLCGCGRSGCLEAYASATGVARTAREWLGSTNRETVLRDKNWDDIQSVDVGRAAAQGDEFAIDVLKFTGTILGAAMADFVAFSAPQAIFLFGGLTNAGDLIKKPIVDALNSNLLKIWKNKVEVKFSQLPEDDAAILGASALAWEI